jgi:CheY-like chemotaxis protein
MNNLNHRTTNIVLADDDEDDYLFLKSAVEQSTSPVNLTHVSNWLELLRVVSRVPLPDVLFLDLNMPVKNGLECLELLRAESKYNTISVIIYSTSSSKKDMDEAYRLGANYYVVKPSSQEAITKLVEKICKMDKDQLLAKQERESFQLNIQA